MTPQREAIFLPGCFLTVMLVAAIRPGAEQSVVPPTLGSLLAAVAVFALLLRSGTLAPDVLLNTNRSFVANMNGIGVLLTLFAASAQLVTALVPESGVPALITWTVLVSLVVQAFALMPDRTRLLRGLLITFGTAFALKFIVLAALSAPATSRIGRALQMLFEGVTVGTLTQRQPHSAEGYLTFAALALYLIGVALLPPAPAKSRASLGRTHELMR